jgi:hypothetical protein
MTWEDVKVEHEQIVIGPYAAGLGSDESEKAIASIRFSAWVWSALLSWSFKTGRLSQAPFQARCLQ